VGRPHSSDPCAPHARLVRCDPPRRDLRPSRRRAPAARGRKPSSALATGSVRNRPSSPARTDPRDISGGHELRPPLAGGVLPPTAGRRQMTLALRVWSVFLGVLRFDRPTASVRRRLGAADSRSGCRSGMSDFLAPIRAGVEFRASPLRRRHLATAHADLDSVGCCSTATGACGRCSDAADWAHTTRGESGASDHLRTQHLEVSSRYLGLWLSAGRSPVRWYPFGDLWRRAEESCSEGCGQRGRLIDRT